MLQRVDLRRIIYMDFHIQHRNTGNPEEFAKKLDLSRSTLFEYIAYLRKELNVSIMYDQYDQTYYYDGTDIYAALGMKLNKNKAEA